MSIIFILGYFVASLPETFVTLHQPCIGAWCTNETDRLAASQMQALEQAGISLDAYPAYVKVVGIDPSTDMLAHAVKKTRENGWGHIDVRQGDALKLEFPETEIQVYGFTAVVYSNYAYELETGGQRITRSGRATEVFVLRKGQWVNPGWHMDSGR